MPRGGVFQRDIALMGGCGLPQGRISEIALFDGARTLFQQHSSAIILLLAEGQVGGVAFHRLRRGREILLGRRELAILHAERRLVDYHLLAIVRVVEPRDKRAFIDPLSLIEGKLDDARLHRFEAEHALVRLDIARNQDRGR